MSLAILGKIPIYPGCILSSLYQHIRAWWEWYRSARVGAGRLRPHDGSLQPAPKDESGAFPRGNAPPPCCPINPLSDHQAAVDTQDRAIDEGSFVGSQEQVCVGDIPGLSEPAGGVFCFTPLSTFSGTTAVMLVATKPGATAFTGFVVAA